MGDTAGARLSKAQAKRHDKLLARARAAPSAGFPEMFVTVAEREAGYRFFDNPRVTPEAMLAPHYSETVAAAAKLKRIYVAHDSSWFKFGGDLEREGLGRIGKGKRNEGFLGHFSLACSADGQRRPLGLLGLSTLAFAACARRKRSRKAAWEDPNRKSKRWAEQTLAVEKRLTGVARAIHVQDREADDYGFLETVCQQGIGFIVRVNHDRPVSLDEGEFGPLRKMVGRLEHQAEREVSLSPRSKNRRPPNLKTHPAREGRLARLHISGVSVTVPRPHTRRGDGAGSLSLNVVHVLEVDPPPGEEPVEWLLYTSEPVETAEQLEAVVDGYRTRWVIEEYFKALKTGCAYESRQLETRTRLENALALLAPVAVQLLALRNLARDDPERPAEEVLAPIELEVLKTISEAYVLPVHPTVFHAAMAIARLGGHVARNGPPGWLVMYRGHAKLRVAVAAVAAWQAARSAAGGLKKSDQS